MCGVDKMVFSSLFFLYLFLPLCVICYAATKKNRYRNAVLIIFSLIFYAWGEPLCVFILIISAALNYILAFAIDGRFIFKCFTFCKCNVYSKRIVYMNTRKYISGCICFVKSFYDFTTYIIRNI